MRRDQHPFRTESAAGLGITRGQLAGPRYRSVFRGVHVAAAVPDTVALRADAALLIAAPEAVICGRTAAVLRGLPVDDDRIVHVGVPTGVSAPSRRPGLCPHREVPTSGSIVRDGRRLVSVPEMWLGFAREVGSGREGLIDLVALGDALLKRGSCSVGELAAHVTASRWRSGVVLARRALPLLRPRVDSPMETRTRLVLLFAGLPCPETGVDVRDEWGEWIGRPDLAYPELRLAFQYEGDDHRSNRRRWQQDIRRDEVLQEHGWYVMRVVADDILRFPEVFVRRVRERMAIQRAVLGIG